MFPFKFLYGDLFYLTNRIQNEEMKNVCLFILFFLRYIEGSV